MTGRKIRRREIRRVKPETVFIPEIILIFKMPKPYHERILKQSKYIRVRRRMTKHIFKELFQFSDKTRFNNYKKVLE